MLSGTLDLVDLTPEEQLLQAKEQLRELLAKKERLLRSSQLKYFQPHPGGQTLFFEAHDAKIRACFSGNRFGKSTIGIVEDCCWLLGYRPFFPEGDPRRYAGIPEHGVKGLLIGANWEKLRDVFVREGDPAVDDRVGKIFHYLPVQMITKTVHNQHGVISQLEVTSEVKGRTRKSILVLYTVRSYLSDPLSAESSDWDFIHVDEPIPEDLWTAVSRGLMDRGGKSWWLLTPIEEPWMYFRADEQSKLEANRFWMYEGDTDENLSLTQESKDDYFSDLSEDEKAARKRGKPLAVSRTVISNFSYDKHVLKGTPHGWQNVFTPPSSYMVCIACDTHPQTPHATLKVAVSPKDEIFVYNERFEKGAISGENSICEWIKKSPEYDQLYYFLLEPGAWVEDQTTKRAYVDDFRAGGLDPQKGSKKRTENIVLMNQAFAQRKIYVLEHCRVFIREIQKWFYDKENKPKDKDDHMMENFLRLLAHDNFEYHEPYASSKSAPVGAATFQDSMPNYGEQTNYLSI